MTAKKSPKTILTERKKEFARLIVEGKLSKPDAYRKAYNRKEMSNDAASKAASRLSKDDEVLSYIADLNAQLGKKTILTKQERMEWLSRVVRTPIGLVNNESDLCQSLSVAESEFGTTTKTTMPSKLGAIAELNKMDGAYEPQEVNISVTPLSDILGSLLPERLLPHK